MSTGAKLSLRCFVSACPHALSQPSYGVLRFRGRFVRPTYHDYQQFGHAHYDVTSIVSTPDDVITSPLARRRWRHVRRTTDNDADECGVRNR